MIRVSVVVIAVLASAQAFAGDYDALIESGRQLDAARQHRADLRHQELLELSREANDTMNAQMQTEAIERGLGGIHEDLQHQNTLLCCPH